jgi:hypothetical protein
MIRGEVAELRRRNRRTIAFAVAAAAIVAAPTLVVATRVIDFGSAEPALIDFGSAEPAPPDYRAVVERFNESKYRPAVEASETRVVSRPMIHGRRHMLMVAPRRSGGHCFGLIEHGRGGGFSCADAGEPVSAGGGNGAYFGSLGSREAARVHVLYKNVAPIGADVVWISEPIDAGFFAVGVPSCPRPRGVVVSDSEGRELARRQIPWSRCQSRPDDGSAYADDLDRSRPDDG